MMLMKREPVGDIDIAVVDSLKVLDPRRPIREAVISAAIATLTRRWLRSRLPVACELLRFGYLSWGHPPLGHF